MTRSDDDDDDDNNSSIDNAGTGNVNRRVSCYSSSSSTGMKHKGTWATESPAMPTMATGNSSINTISPANTVEMILTCLIGLALSGYATYVEIQVEKDDGYQAMCDISEKISCTKVFASRYGKGFGIIGWIFGEESLLNTPNGELGIIFYILIGTLNFLNNTFALRVQLILAVLANCMSLYLAYLLYFVLDDLCVVCVGTYVVNFALLILTWQRHQLVRVNVEHDNSSKLN